MDTSNSKNQPPKGFDIKREILKYASKWYWFVVFVVIGICVAHLILRYTVPKYEASSKIILYDNNSNGPSEMFLEDLNLFNDEGRRIEDEIVILKSRSIMSEVVKSLGINVQYFVQGKLMDLELYKNSPVRINFLASDSIVYNSSYAIRFRIETPTSVSILSENNSQKKRYDFGEKLESPLGPLVITPVRKDLKGSIGQEYLIRVNKVRDVADRYRNAILITPQQKGSNILSLYLTDPVSQKATDIVNNLVLAYNQITINEKKLLAEVTAEFIDKRIEAISKELSDVDLDAERFKTGNKLTNIESEANIFLDAGSQTEQQINQIGIEMSMVQYMSDYLNESGFHDLLPSGVGLKDESLGAITKKYNELINERKRLLKSSNEANPVVANLDQELTILKATLKGSLENRKNTLKIQLDGLKERENRINSKIYSVPGQEKKFRDISRQQQIKESLYLYLLEKREESTIALSNTQPNAKVVDIAYANKTPISPRRLIFYLGGILGGLFLPFSSIYLKDLLDNKIHSKEEIQEILPNISLLGELPRHKKGKMHAIKQYDRSAFAESLRLLRTNLDYFIKGRKGSRKIIQVTSSIAGEGKSMVVYNLARTIVNSGNSVLIIGADIRNPGIDRFTRSLKGVKGLSDYLYDDGCRVDEVVQMTPELENLWVVKGGKVPPNPAELLMNGRMKELIDKVEEHFDYILIDTAPSMLVTDTLVISEFVDHTIYVVRANFLNKKALDHVKEVYKNEKIPGLMLLLNDVESSNLGYGTRYGYGYYGQKKKKMFSFS